MDLRIILVCFFTAVLSSHAQLAVTASHPIVTGHKIVLMLTMQNQFTNTVHSARAACFLIYDRGQIVGQTTKWVIGENKTSLASGATGKYYFVITSTKPINSTNLTAQLAFSRLVLDNGQQPNVNQAVLVTTSVMTQK